MNHILRNVQHFAKLFIDDIMIKSLLFHDYLTHLRIIFDIFSKYNMSIKSIKVFLNNSNVVLFNQKINALKLLTTDENLKAITNCKFLRTLKNLKHYLELTDYIRDRVYYYFAIVKSLQNLRTMLLKTFSSSDRKRTQFTSKINI